MRTRWTVIRMTTGALMVVTGLVSCSTVRSGADVRADEEKIKIEYNAKGGPNKQDRIKVKKQGGGQPDAFNRCPDTTDATCRFGQPIDANGRPILGTITAEDGTRQDLNEVYFVSDAASPGRTCVCYGNRCYCN